jgi:hypothetical protein
VSGDFVGVRHDLESGGHVKGYPENDKVQPDYLNISRIATPAQILELTRQRSQVNVLDQKKKR